MYLYNIHMYIYCTYVYVEAANAAPSSQEILQLYIENLCKD